MSNFLIQKNRFIQKTVTQQKACIPVIQEYRQAHHTMLFFSSSVIRTFRSLIQKCFIIFSCFDMLVIGVTVRQKLTVIFTAVTAVLSCTVRDHKRPLMHFWTVALFFTHDNSPSLRFQYCQRDGKLYGSAHFFKIVEIVRRLLIDVIVEPI